MIPLAIPNISGNEADYLMECVRTNFVSSVGPFVAKLEKLTAVATGATACAVTASGTSALHTALISIGVRPGDLVVLPSFTFIASANAVAHCHATPIFVDISADSWCMDPTRLSALLDGETKRVDGNLIHVPSCRRIAAIMPVYTLGTPADMDLIRVIATEHRLPVIADAAAAIGARYRGRNLAGLADLSAISFNGNKTITAGGGGAVIGNDENLVKLIRHLSTTARIGDDYDHDQVGFNYRMTNLQAAVGCAQIERLDEFVSIKRKIRRSYDTAFARLPGIQPFPDPHWAESASWFSGLVLDHDYPLSARQVCQRLVARGIGARSFWKPAHLQQPYADAPRGMLPVTESLWSRIVTLPCSTQLSNDDQGKVIDAVKSVIQTCFTGTND